MKNLALFIFLTFSFAIFSNLSAQVTPAGAGDSDLRDNNVRMRSNEMERIKRDANKNSASQMNDEIDKKFPEINEDYSGIQRSQEAIVKAYTTGKEINYAQIEKSANDLYKNAERLNSNLFTTKTKSKKEKSDKKDDKKDSDKKAEAKKADDDKKEKGVKELIVDLDNAVGSFVSSTMFQNLQNVDQKVADKAQFDLAQILKISSDLSKEAAKLK